jgi:hypothetical protein
VVGGTHAVTAASCSSSQARLQAHGRQQPRHGAVPCRTVQVLHVHCYASFCCRARNLIDGPTIRAAGPNLRKLWKGLRQADGNFGLETFRGPQGDVSTNSPAKMHLPRHRDPMLGSWSRLAKALPPAGRNPQGELASPVLLNVGLNAAQQICAPRAIGAPWQHLAAQFRVCCGTIYSCWLNRPNRASSSATKCCQ